MAENNYPSTTLKSKESEETHAEKITRGGVIQKKKSTGKRIAESLITEDGKSVKDYVIFDVIIPAVKDMIASAIGAATDLFIYGKDSSGHRRRSGSGPNVISYDRMYSGSGSSSKRVSRDAYAIDILSFSERGDAERVLDELRDQINRYGKVSVFYYYDICGLTAEYTMRNYGWTDLDYACIERERGGNGGYYIDLPRPEKL